MAGSSTASEILGRIENDAVFSGFLESGFDPASFASKIVRADVGRAAAAAGAGAATAAAAVGATPVLQLQQGVDGLGSSSNGGGGAASAESVSSQAEITLDSMSSHIARIEAAIRSHILDNEEDFLGSVGGVSELSRRTEEFRDGVRELRRSFARVQREVSEPHEAVRVRTQQLKNLHDATRLLKRALRFLSALRRLRGQEDVLGLEAAAAAAVTGSAAGGGGVGAAGGRSAGGAGGGGADLRELAKAAQSLQELESTLRDPEVAELEVVGRERAYVEACGAAVRRMSADSLARGMKSLNQTDIGGALQVFFNLECLPARVKACVTHLAHEADEAMSEALQPEALADATSSSSAVAVAEAVAAGGAGGAGADQQQQRSTSPTPGGIGGGGAGGGGGGVGRRTPASRDASARRRTASMRAHAGKLAAALHGTSMEAWGLQRVLDKKRDPTTRALLDATVRADRGGGGQGGLSLRAGAYRAYWDGLCRAVRGSVERALEADEAVGGGGGVALVAMYPFLRKAFLRLISRLEEATAARQQQPQQQGSGAARGGGDGLIASGGGSGAAAAAFWQRPGAVGQQQRPAGGILGGSRWLALALEDDYNNLSLDPSAAGDEEQERQWDRRGAEAGAGPASGRRVLGLRGGKGGRGGGGEGGADGDGGRENDSSDGARLLEGLGPLRDLFLARSLERLTTPVEQMFPQFDGYMAAVPSKHDLASFVRSIHAELSLAVPAGSVGSAAATGSSEAEAAAGGGGLGGGGGSLEADFSLLPILLKGVVQAARLFCTKVEAMQSVEKGAYTFGGGSNAALGGRAGSSTGDDDMMGNDMPSSAAAAAAAPIEAWAPTLEQEHNLQLLELVVKLREALLGIPALVLPSPPTPAAAAYGVDCRERVAEAVRALDDLASRVFLEPYLSGVARALEDILSKMHRENFGPGVSAMATSEHHGGGGGSLFLHELQRALAALQADHFTRIAALRTPTAEAALRSLAARVLRAYVTHCALIRPLSEGGKARVAQDMATLEIALSPLARVSELGAVYLESRAFRTLLFVDDAEDEDGDNNNQGGGGGGGGRGRGRDSRSFLTEGCMAHLRPTSVWHYLFSGAPDELSSPHVSRGMSQQAYVTWLLGGGAAQEAEAREKGKEAEAAGGGGGGDKASGGKTYTERSTLSPDTSYMAEAGAWSVVQACLDEYHQRRSVAVATGSGNADGGSAAAGSTEMLPRAVGLLPEAGPALLSAYEARCS
ncbi:unnamed protein product [Ectocarpus sp. 4 AP-2014]